MRLTLAGGGVYTGITDSNGSFSFASIPVPVSFTLYMEDAAGVGIVDMVQVREPGG